MNRNTLTLVTVLGVVGGMIGLSFASVPLYKVFCRVTGYGGTTQVSSSLPGHVLKRRVKVLFSANLGDRLDWTFKPDQRFVNVHLGQQGLASFTARNNGTRPITAVALYNVTPPKAGIYFHKLQCFCFGEQTLNPGEKADYPVIFYVDPSLNDDPNMADVTTITLSYTFFQKDTKALDDAIARFTADPSAPGPANPEKPSSGMAAPAALAGTVALPPEKQ